MSKRTAPSSGFTSRRAFIQNGALIILGTATSESVKASATSADPIAKFGLITDIHYADTPSRGARFYRDSIDKVAMAIDQFNRAKVDATIHLGDLIDALPSPDAASELRFIQRINQEFLAAKSPRHYVLGNHCIYSLTKPHYLDAIERPKSNYSFEQNGLHIIVLDACYRQDGVAYAARNYEWTDTEIPPSERDWLKEDLKAAKKPVIVFAHQRLDLAKGADEGVFSSAEVRSILQQSGKVIAVFQGHAHVNDLRTIDGIAYATLQAVVEKPGKENMAHSMLQVFADGSLRLEGFGKHADHRLNKGYPGTRPEDP
jgi:alkaline phosphatase